jgi:hypothetical protein
MLAHPFNPHKARAGRSSSGPLTLREKKLMSPIGSGTAWACSTLKGERRFNAFCSPLRGVLRDAGQQHRRCASAVRPKTHAPMMFFALSAAGGAGHFNRSAVLRLSKRVWRNHRPLVLPHTGFLKLFRCLCLQQQKACAMRRPFSS